MAGGSSTSEAGHPPSLFFDLFSGNFRERLIKTVFLRARLAFCDHFLIMSFVFSLAVGLWNEIPLDLRDCVFYLAAKISVLSLVT